MAPERCVRRDVLLHVQAVVAATCKTGRAEARPSGGCYELWDPIWLWSLLVLPILAFFFAHAEQQGAEKLQKFVAARLLPQLAGTVNRGRRIFRFVLLLLVLALVVISLARPRWGYAYYEVKRKGLDLLLAVDVSRSMLSNDVQPSRLERVKLATQDLINELQGDRVGLIAFAGRAFLQAPLTIDYDAAVDSINELDTKIIPEGGTNISDAIALATRTFGKSAIGNRALIIFTDGEDLEWRRGQRGKSGSRSGSADFYGRCRDAERFADSDPERQWRDSLRQRRKRGSGQIKAR